MLQSSPDLWLASDPDRHINVRVGPTGHPLPCDEDPQLDWVSMAVLEGGRGIASLETTAHRDMDELILERLVVGVRAVLERLDVSWSETTEPLLR